MPHTHTHTSFGHGPEGGVNRLNGGWAVTGVESNYLVRGTCFALFLKECGWEVIYWGRNLFPLVEGKVLLLGK